MVGKYMLRKKFFIPRNEYSRQYLSTARLPSHYNVIVSSEWSVDTDDEDSFAPE